MRYQLGIVLSGGGIRAVAHAGVLAALAEADIVPDAISGTSAGAIVGALWAAGKSPEEIVEFFAEVSPFRLGHVALRGPGLLDAERVGEPFRQAFPEDSFEALSKPLFVAATDLLHGRTEIFDTGPLIRPLIASSAVPLVFTPVAIGGSLYADGGILDNFPIEPLLGLCRVLIGVHVTGVSPIEAGALDSSFAVAHRAFELSMYMTATRNFHRCDLVLTPNGAPRVGLFDTKARHSLFEAGYKSTRERLDEVRSVLDRFR